jgi:adenylate cyclase
MNDAPAAFANSDIVNSIITSGMEDVPVATLVEGAMLRLVAAGVPLHRMQVGFRILHPLFDGMSIFWTEEAGVEVEYFETIDADGSVFRLSPFYYMLTNDLTELRLRLDRDAIVERFPLLAQFRDRGLTDYLAMVVAFGDAPMTPETHNGLGISWSTRQAEGFSAADIATMRQVLAPLALALRVVIKDQITKNTLNTFHGPLIGERILSGAIKRGAGERLSAALWYSDLRNSTGLADTLSVDRFLDLLNTYFDCAAGAVMAQGGQVLDIIGDAILAFFPASDADGEAEACARALDAAADAHARLAALRQSGNQPARAIAFRIGVHFGDVVFGNAGTAERLKFGVIGRAVNEVARTVDSAKALGQPIVVSEEAAKRVQRPFTDLGLHDLRGMPAPRRLWALEVPPA